MKKFFLLLLFALAAHSCYCQLLSSYAFSAFTGTYTPIAGAIAPVSGGFGTDDAYSNAVPIGFSFTYCGTAYNTVSIDWNGWVALGENIEVSTSTWVNDLSNSLGHNFPRPILAPLWTDLYYSTSTQITYLTSGTAGSRTFTIQWNNAGFYSSPAPHEDIQLILHEGSGMIDFVYSKISIDTYATTGCAIGITGGTGSHVTGITPFWSLNNAGTAPVASMVTETTHIASQPATNQVYRWTPCHVGAITGPAEMCAGSLVSLGDTTAGGTWSSYSTGAASIDTVGTVTSVSPGTATIIYTKSPGCSASLVVTVDTYPTIAFVGGASLVCAGANIFLSDSISGGTWSCSNANAIAGPLPGIIDGINAGVDTITYTVTNACGDTSATKIITVNPSPAPITGTTEVCVGSSVQLYDSTPGGVWSSLDITVAAIDSFTGSVTGISAGGSWITYTLPTGCTSIAPIGLFNCVTAVPHITAAVQLFSINPNPNNGTFILSGNLAPSNENAFLRIIDLTGRTVYDKKMQTSNGIINEPIRMDEANAHGTYLLEIQTNGYRKVFRFEVE